MLVTLKLCIPCWRIRTGDVDGNTKPCKVTLGRECADCRKPATGTLVPYEAEVVKKYESVTSRGDSVSFMNRGG